MKYKKSKNGSERIDTKLDDAFLYSEPGDPCLLIGDAFYFGRDEVKELIAHMFAWVETGSLAVSDVPKPKTLDDLAAEQGVGPVDFDKMPTIEDEDDGFEEEIEYCRHGDKKEIERLKQKNNDLMKRLEESRAEMTTDVYFEGNIEKDGLTFVDDKIKQLEKDLEKARELVFDLFHRECGIENEYGGFDYDHMCSATCEHAQENLIKWGLLKKEQCLRE